MTDHNTLMKNGLWKNNPALVQLLGLCPLLAVTSTVTNALGLGIATTLVLMASNTIISLVRHSIPRAVRIPIFVMIIASLVTCIQLLMEAYTFQLHQSLGIFIPLIVTNCIIIGRAEAFASQNTPLPALFDGFWMGIGMTSVLVLLGGIRELLSQGSLFSGIEQLFGAWASPWHIQFIHFDDPFLLAMLPPGAFFGVGLLIALKNAIESRTQKKKPSLEKAFQTPSENHE